MCPAGRDDPLNSVVGKVFAILGGFQPGDRGLTLGQLAARTGVAKSTIHRLLGELIDEGVVVTDVDGRYVLGLRLFELARLVPRIADLRETALPFIEDLYEATHETVHLGVLDGIEVVYVERIAGHGASPAPTRVGGRMPAHCTGLGKAMLAHAPAPVVGQVLASELAPATPYTITNPALLKEELGRIAKTGVAFDREEARVGLVCAAAPIFGPGNRVVAGISVSGPSSRTRLESIATAVHTAALGLSRTVRMNAGSGVSLPQSPR